MWMNKLNACLMRWHLALQPYMFKVVHCLGQANGSADCLSRTPWPPMSANEFAPGEERRNVEGWEPGAEDSSIHR